MSILPILCVLEKHEYKDLKISDQLAKHGVSPVLF